MRQFGPDGVLIRSIYLHPQMAAYVKMTCVEISTFGLAGILPRLMIIGSKSQLCLGQEYRLATLYIGPLQIHLRIVVFYADIAQFHLADVELHLLFVFGRRRSGVRRRTGFLGKGIYHKLEVARFALRLYQQCTRIAQLHILYHHLVSQYLAYVHIHARLPYRQHRSLLQVGHVHTIQPHLLLHKSYVYAVYLYSSLQLLAQHLSSLPQHPLLERLRVYQHHAANHQDYSQHHYAGYSLQYYFQCSIHDRKLDCFARFLCKYKYK